MVNGASPAAVDVLSFLHLDCSTTNDLWYFELTFVNHRHLCLHHLWHDYRHGSIHSNSNTLTNKEIISRRTIIRPASRVPIRNIPSVVVNWRMDESKNAESYRMPSPMLDQGFCRLDHGKRRISSSAAWHRIYLVCAVGKSIDFVLYKLHCTVVDNNSSSSSSSSSSSNIILLD